MRAIVTVIGQDRTGIVAGVSTRLTELDVNIIDISQTIMDGFFNMIMMCETPEDAKNTLDVVQGALNELGEKLGVEIRAQHADIFLSMHRI